MIEEAAHHRIAKMKKHGKATAGLQGQGGTGQPPAAIPPGTNSVEHQGERERQHPETEIAQRGSAMSGAPIATGIANWRGPTNAGNDGAETHVRRPDW